MLCEAEIGYICDFIIYTGNSIVFNELYTNYELSTKVVKHLLNRFLGNGYYVTVDNYYMSPELVDLLIAQKADIYGRVRINRRDLSTEFEFLVQVVEELLHKYDDAASGQKNLGRPPTRDNPNRLTERHFISHVPPTPAKHEPTRQCKIYWEIGTR
ncbi:piggyBac transposable element-derived protein 4 [Nephila pilipes]|uniref:PiggyBac transposable element-derived protein 4 n=1 Tax=Nephila pilipes TaxID=299642 RepID=A0A8X6QDH9_NEPPI|nr:piggyBac transposable element-derived protein 4 [Nephila pilipes]GFU15785.1 piggyBac transposable element-derived protein 4 [Nephila pilipes]